MDYRICNTNWCSDIKYILTNINLLEHFLNKTTINIELAKQRIVDFYSNHWTTNITTVPKLRTYRLLKPDFGKEQYVDLNLKRNERSVLVQFRCDILQFRIETRRYIGEPPNQRLCNHCDSRTVEDECHLL